MTVERRRPALLALAAALLLTSSTVAAPEDWPDFRGPRRDGVSSFRGLLLDWPAAGPPQVWRAPIGMGYSGLAVSRGRIYTMDGRGDDEYAVCLDAATGKEVWRTRVGGLFVEVYGNGPRSTPVVDLERGRIYVLGARGDLAALDLRDGTPVWSVDFRAKFKSEILMWGFTASPALVGDRLILEVGGPKEPKDFKVAAFHRDTGELLWTAPSHTISFANPLVIEFQGIRQVIFFNDDNLESFTPDGKLLWLHPFDPTRGIKIAIPVFIAPDLIFASLSYDVGAMMLRLKRGPDGGLKTEEVWRRRDVRNHFNASVAVDGFIYGFDNSNLKCIEAATGATRWSHRGGLGKGSLIWADGHLLVLSENGRLLLVASSAESVGEVWFG